MDDFLEFALDRATRNPGSSHRKGFEHYWKRKSRSKPGRSPISKAIILLIRRMSQDNVTWGAPRIVDELALLGHTVAESTVAKYMVVHRPTEPSQSWKAFLNNHMTETAACDFFVVQTVDPEGARPLLSNETNNRLEHRCIEPVESHGIAPTPVDDNPRTYPAKPERELLTGPPISREE